jgi:hypothetical protein
MENTQDKNKRRKRAVIIAALIAIPGLLVAGVFASNTTISLNSDTPLSLGAGYTTATTCDDAVDVAATQAYSGNAFEVTEIRVSNIDQIGTQCGNKILTLVVVPVTGSNQTVTWSIASVAANTDTFIFGQSTTASGNNIYASTALSSFAVDNLATIAVGIS